MHPRYTPESRAHELYFGNANIPTHLWSIAGNSRQAGKTTVTSAIGGLLEYHEHFVHMLNSDLRNSADSQEQDFETRTDFSLNHLFQGIDAEFLESLTFIVQHALGAASLADEPKSRHILLDINSSLSHDALDFFLIADYPIVVIRPTLDSLDELALFLKSCLFRLMEHLLPDQEEKLDLLTKQIGPRMGHSLVNDMEAVLTHCDITSRLRIRQALADLTLYVIINPFQDPTSYRFAVRTIQNYYQPLLPGLNILGTLPNHAVSSRLLRALHYQFITSKSDPRLRTIARYLAYKIKTLTMGSSKRDALSFELGHDTLYVDDLFSIRQQELHQSTEHPLHIFHRLN